MRRMYITSLKHGVVNGRIQNVKRVYLGYRINDQFGVFYDYDKTDYMHCGMWTVIHLATGFGLCSTESRKAAVNAVNRFSSIDFSIVTLPSDGNMLSWPNRESRAKAKDIWYDLKAEGIIIA